MSTVSVRYIIDDVPAAMRFYTTLLGSGAGRLPRLRIGRTGRSAPPAER